jgi:ATP-dependent DNA helicase RecQ
MQAIEQILKERFHLETFRPGQREAITVLLEQGGLLCIQPTGYGKSLLYQLPAVMLPGVTIVVSPLLALMRDQIQQLGHRFNIPAGSLNSDQEEHENAAIIKAALAKKLKILFIAPEKLDRLDTIDFLLSLPISLLVIDEAHCISTWGHDFRPSYRQILPFIHVVQKKYPELKLLALTATANKKTEEDIKEQLSSDQHEVIVQRQGMSRPNIHLSVFKANDFFEKLGYLDQCLKQLKGTGLIYCATRENTELVAEYLQRQGYKACAYHAGFSPDKKRILQQDFLDNRYQVIAATNALGMGIDKQDLRYIIHFDIPSSITAYYQEVGRCGRDGQMAQGILLFDEADKKIQQYFIDSAQPSQHDFQQVISVLKDSKISMGLNMIKLATGLHPTRITVILAELIEQGFITKKLEGKKQIYALLSKKGEVDLSRYEQQWIVRQTELQEMLQYASQHEECYMSLLREALGDASVQNCGVCSVCKLTDIAIDKTVLEKNDAQSWLDSRFVTFDLGKLACTEEGIALLDGKLRTPRFIQFMKSRTQIANAVDEELLTLLKDALDVLKQRFQFSAVIVMPSRTWVNRQTIVTLIARHLNIPVLEDYLYWKHVPESRQGELLNNDQRKFNVDKHMTHAKKKLPEGTILLLDDYTGSGATFKEAARVLRKEVETKEKIIPFAMASVRWKLGKRGMI